MTLWRAHHTNCSSSSRDSLVVLRGLVVLFDFVEGASRYRSCKLYFCALPVSPRKRQFYEQENILLDTARMSVCLFVSEEWNAAVTAPAATCVDIIFTVDIRSLLGVCYCFLRETTQYNTAKFNQLWQIMAAPMYSVKRLRIGDEFIA